MVALVFVIYDVMVLKRNEMQVSNAAETNAIVTSLLPDHLRERLISHQQQERQKKQQNGNLKSFLNDGANKDNVMDGMNDSNRTSAPLADLFLETTIIFADISGFTAWSSVREPTQVFVLLECLYGAVSGNADTSEQAQEVVD